jgi:hypothetical protein
MFLKARKPITTTIAHDITSAVIALRRFFLLFILKRFIVK